MYQRRIHSIQVYHFQPLICSINRYTLVFHISAWVDAMVANNCTLYSAYYVLGALDKILHSI